MLTPKHPQLALPKTAKTLVSHEAIILVTLKVKTFCLKYEQICKLHS